MAAPKPGQSIVFRDGIVLTASLHRQLLFFIFIC